MKTSWVGIEQCQNRLFYVSSPVNPMRKYHELNIFYANSINFGVTTAEKTMSVMQSVGAYKRVQLTLSLGDRKELDIQFPYTIDEDMRKLRFRLPLSLVDVIYKVIDKEAGQYALIIPYETPPQFYMQLKEDAITKTCNPNDRSWLDWQAWYRQTDIVDRATRRHLDTVPVMTHKDEAIIDIG
jgi:RNA-dependent RNA polymerase